MRHIIWLIALLLVAPASANPVTLQGASSFAFSDGFLAFGELEIDVGLESAVAVNVRELQFNGELTACRVDAGADAVEIILNVLESCRDATKIEGPVVTFQDGSDIVADGTWTVGHEGPVIALPSMEGTGLVTRIARGTGDGGFVVDGVLMKPSADGKSEPETWDGTQWAFTLEAEEFVWVADGYATRAVVQSMALNHSVENTIADFGDPYVLVDLQEALLGPDARSSRAELTKMLGGFGRVKSVVDGALIGYNNGTIGDLRLDGKKASLLQFSGITLNVTAGTNETTWNRTWQGEGELHISVTDTLVVDGKAGGSLWWLVITSIIIAVIVAVVRRRPEPAGGVRQQVNLGLLVATIFAFDWFVSGKAVGSVIGAIYYGWPLGQILASAAFTISCLLIFCAWVMPLRSTVRRILGQRKLAWAGDAVVWLIGSLTWLFWPVHYLDSALAFLRL